MSYRGVPRSGVENKVIDWRETSDGIVLYDTANPKAWIHVEFVAGSDTQTRPHMMCPACGVIAEQRGKPKVATTCGACGVAFDRDDE